MTDFNKCMNAINVQEVFLLSQLFPPKFLLGRKSFTKAPKKQRLQTQECVIIINNIYAIKIRSQFNVLFIYFSTENSKFTPRKRISSVSE